MAGLWQRDDARDNSHGCVGPVATEPESKALVGAADGWHTTQVARSGGGLCRVGEGLPPGCRRARAWPRYGGGGTEPGRLTGGGDRIRRLGLGAHWSGDWKVGSADSRAELPAKAAWTLARVRWWWQG